jgi:hypothetical protein
MKLSSYILTADAFDQVKQKYIKEGIEKNLVNEYVNRFNEYRKQNLKEFKSPDFPVPSIEINRRTDISAYKDFHQLEQVVDYIRTQRLPKEQNKTKQSTERHPINTNPNV